MPGDRFRLLCRNQIKGVFFAANLLLVFFAAAGAKIDLAIPTEKFKLGIVSTFPPTRCGIAQFTANMTGGLRACDKNMEIEIFNLVWSDPQPSRVVAGMKIIDFQRSGDEELSEFLRLAEYVKAGKFDAVLINHEYWMISNNSHYVDLLSALQNSTTIYTILHTPVSYPKLFQRTQSRKLASLSDYVIVMSWKAKHYLHSSYGIPEKKIVYIPHGVKIVPPNNKHLKTFRIPKDKFIIYADGIMHSDKGLERMVEAMRILKARNVLGNILLLVAGVSSGDGLYMDRISALIDSYGLSDYFRWIPKFLTIEEMATLHQRADVYITLFNEVIPTSGTLTFAMYAGGTVISTPYRYALELLGVDNTKKRGTYVQGLKPLSRGEKKIGESGVGVPFSEPNAIADAIEQLMQNPKLAKMLAKRAKKRVAGYSWSNVCCHLAYFLRTKKNIPVNPDPYNRKLLPSSCRWTGEKATEFAGKYMESIPDGSYIIYCDSFVKITGSIIRQRITRLLVEGNQGAGDLLSVAQGRVIAKPGNRVKVIARNKKYIWIKTPNLLLVVGAKDSKSPVDFIVLYESIFGNAKGVLGSTLRRKYDLTRPSIPAADTWRTIAQK